MHVAHAAHTTVHVAASRVHSCCSEAELGARSAMVSIRRRAMTLAAALRGVSVKIMFGVLKRVKQKAEHVTRTAVRHKVTGSLPTAWGTRHSLPHREDRPRHSGHAVPDGAVARVLLDGAPWLGLGLELGLGLGLGLGLA